MIHDWIQRFFGKAPAGRETLHGAKGVKKGGRIYALVDTLPEAARNGDLNE